MKSSIFKEVLNQLDNSSVSTLIEKNKRYGRPDDVLHNFNAGAEIMGGTPAQACWGYLTKHLVALRDMVEKNEFDKVDFLEKCQDSINYIRFLYCIGVEENVEKMVGDCKEALEAGKDNNPWTTETVEIDGDKNENWKEA